jgi:2-polyprenyl-6-methoxyphenol hydroxylase-like FAD-dependent oxidoreductase
MRVSGAIDKDCLSEDAQSPWLLPMTMRDVDVAVVGGGLGGLAITVGLRNRGFRAHVYGKQLFRRGSATQAGPVTVFPMCMDFVFTLIFAEGAPELRTSTSTLIGLGANAFTALEALDPRLLPALM